MWPTAAGSGEQTETAFALKQIMDAGVRVFFYLEDRERVLDTAIEKFMLSLHQLRRGGRSERARERTYDALLRKACAGASRRCSWTASDSRPSRRTASVDTGFERQVTYGGLLAGYGIATSDGVYNRGSLDDPDRIRTGVEVQPERLLPCNQLEPDETLWVPCHFHHRNQIAKMTTMIATARVLFTW